jgi:hypothetical protein
MSLRGAARWWFDVLVAGETPWQPNGATCAEWFETPDKRWFYDHYTLWHGRQRNKQPITDRRQFWKELRSFVKVVDYRPWTNDSNRPRLIHLPSLDACRKQFEDYIDAAIEWD